MPRGLNLLNLGLSGRLGLAVIGCAVVWAVTLWAMK